VDAYKGDVEEYFPEAANVVPCEELEEADAVNFLGIECLRFDLDFGAQPNIFEVDGTTVVGLGQKSGVYHILDAATMGEEINYKQLLGFPSAVGGIVGSAAFDGESIYGPHTIGGYLWSIDKDDAAVRWVTPVADAVHWGNPVTYANRVLYTADLKGFLNAYDAQTGAQLLALPMTVGSQTRENPTFTWGGVTVARHTIYASIGVGLTSAGLPSMPNGFVIAYRPLPNPLP
jgi:outer membrane protein assembly factor BamB